MQINLFINDDFRNSNIVKFCMQSQQFNFIFYELSKIKLLLGKNNLIILKENISINNFTKKLDQYLPSNKKDICFLMPNKYNKINLINSNIIINYPIKFDDFENKLNKVFKATSISYLNLVLQNDTILSNKSNDKQSYLTEIEAKIITLFFESKIVNKEILNKIVLNQSPLIESKSVESHLYRLRKKLIHVDSERKITSTKNKCLKII